MKKAVIYVHGKGGTAEEAEHYRTHFPGYDVFGFDYRSSSPWEVKEEFPAYFGALRERYGHLILIANSIGAYFSMCSGTDALFEAAYFISPIVDMEGLILSMMTWAEVTEDVLRERGTVETSFGEVLSWEYLSYVRAHPPKWSAPTAILYGSRDDLTPYSAIKKFSDEHGASLTVMEDGEHWFHTDAQMRFLDRWLGEHRI